MQKRTQKTKSGTDTYVPETKKHIYRTGRRIGKRTKDKKQNGGPFL